MQVVRQADWIWKQPGVGATEVGALMGYPPTDDDHLFAVLGRIVYKREIKGVRKVAELEQGTPDWLKWRQKGVGGSELGTLMGVNPYESAEQLWNDKVNPSAPKAENENMKRGKAKEPEARALYEQLVGHPMRTICCIHDRYDFVRCSLDGINDSDDLILEIKCSRERNHEKYLFCSDLKDPIERQWMFHECFPYYRYQVLYQLLITGAKRCHFVGYCPDWYKDHRKFALVTLYPEPAEQERVLQRVVEFWGYVERRELPPADWLKPHGRPPEALGGAIAEDHPELAGTAF